MTGPDRRWIAYRRTLKPRARSLRADPTPAERKLWYELLRDLPQKFTRQKPLGSKALELQGVRVIRFTNADVMQNFEAVCAAVLGALEECAASSRRPKT